jgi:hypothetical protein
MTTETTAGPELIEQDQLTRAQKALLALSADVAEQLAIEYGVCVRPLAMRRIDLTTGRMDVVPVPCGATNEAKCGPCADKARRLRIVQCREGWHLEHEPNPDPPEPTAKQKELMAIRADLHTAYREGREAGEETECAELADAVAELDAEIRHAGIRGRLEPLDPSAKNVVKRSTRRRQDAPNLPRRPVEKRTVGQVYGGRYRPSTFLTLTLDSYGRVDADGAATDLDSYDYRRAARDAIHFPAVVDRFWQNARRCVGWEVQYFGTVEPQKRGAPHFHAAIRGTIPRWEPKVKGFVDPDTRAPLPSFEQACEDLDEPAHVVRFGAQVHVKGILGGTEEAGRHVGYLTKYLTKSVHQAAGLADDATARQREHARRLVAALRITPCSPRCPVWLLYGVQPKGARMTTEPGACKSKAHRPEYLGIGGRRVLVSRKWSNKTLDDHRAERAAFVRQLLTDTGIQPAHAVEDGPFMWERTKPGDSDVPTRPTLLMAAISQRQRWRAEYLAAQLKAGEQPDDNRSATDDHEARAA